MPCDELRELIDAYIAAMETSTDAHREYLEALDGGDDGRIAVTRRRLDRVDEDLVAAHLKIRAHRTAHGCD